MAHLSDYAWIRSVLGERGVGDLRQRPERVGEQRPVEAVVGFCGELQQPLARPPSGPARASRVNVSALMITPRRCQRVSRSPQLPARGVAVAAGRG
jgi:hypothetical protein